VQLQIDVYHLYPKENLESKKNLKSSDYSKNKWSLCNLGGKLQTRYLS
jgi:hypothetical protein